MTGARVRNLTFHGVGEPPRELAPGEAAVWLDEPRFLAVLDAVRDRDDVRLSFDDSNRSDVDVALPALVDRGLTATFFVLAGRLDEPGHLGVDDLRRLVAAGMRIGSHGLHHRDWRSLEASELTAELVDSRRLLAVRRRRPGGRRVGPVRLLRPPRARPGAARRRLRARLHERRRHRARRRVAAAAHVDHDVRRPGRGRAPRAARRSTPPGGPRSGW